MQRQTTSTGRQAPSPSSASVVSHDDYRPYLASLAAHFATNGDGPLFTTDVDGRDLWNVWLTALPEAEQQGHNCHACRSFVERYGNLVRLDEHGTPTSAIFGDVEGIYTPSAAICASVVENAKVTGVHVSSDVVLGTPMTRDKKRPGHTWHHMHASQPPGMLYRGRVKTADQRAAELLEDHGTLCRALAEFSADTVKTALSIAEADALYRSEKIQGRLRWLADLHDVPKKLRPNAIWRAVATAPAGFCHVKSSVVGSLLESIASGMSFEQVKRSFDLKMHPLQYQRPTAPPSEGNIAQAEAIVAKLGIEPSLLRRFARLEDILVKTWEPRPSAPENAPGGVFSHLRGKSKADAVGLIAKAPVMTWEKFARDVLPTVQSLAVAVPGHGGFHALVTAVNEDAPPIIQWDSPDARNPVTWYTYSGGSYCSQWNLINGAWATVTTVTPMPNMWQPGFAHQGEGVVFLLEGCRDTMHVGSSLFPELLKADLHAVRSTIEAHSRRVGMAGAKEATACGLTIRKGSAQAPLKLRATSHGVTTDYTIDRWE